MSDFYAKTFHPITGKLENARWMDDHFGRHRYGVQFYDGHIAKALDCEQVGPKAADLIEKIEYTTRKVSLTDAERVSDIRGLLNTSVNETGKSK
jgi:hypothetical protein